MRYRPHRGGLAESLAETIEIESLAALAQHLQTEPQLLEFAPYGGDDARIGWKDVHIVSITGFGIVGYCEGIPT